MKLRSTSSADKNFPVEITWITWKTQPNLEIWPFLNALLQKWVWDSGLKIGPATGATQPPTVLPHPWFLFLFCSAATQLALQVHQEWLQVICSNKETQNLTVSNSTAAMDLGHMNAVLKWCISIVFDDHFGYTNIFDAQKWVNRTLFGWDPLNV